MTLGVELYTFTWCYGQKKTLWSLLTGMYLFWHLIWVVIIVDMWHTICNDSPRHSPSWFLVGLSGRACVCPCIAMGWSLTLSFLLLWDDIIQHVPCWVGSWSPPHHTYYTTLLSAQGVCVCVCVANLYMPTNYTDSPYTTVILNHGTISHSGVFYDPHICIQIIPSWILIEPIAAYKLAHTLTQKQTHTSCS